MYAVRSKSGRVLRRFATRAEAEAFTRGLTAHSPSAKDPRVMTGPEINKELDRLDKKSSEIGTKMIAEGRGHETYNDTYKIGRGHDPLTDAWIDCAERQSALRNEISLRYGPRAPSRLPRGFGPRKTSYSPTGGITLAEAKRLGEIRGSMYAVGWIAHNSPSRDDLESVLVSQSTRQGWADIGRQKSRSAGIYGGTPQQDEKRRSVFVEGFVEAALKEFKREYGRQGSPTSSLKLREVQRVFEAHLASGKGRAAAASLTIRDLENPRVPHGDLVQAVERVSHLKKYQRSPSSVADIHAAARHIGVKIGHRPNMGPSRRKPSLGQRAYRLVDRGLTRAMTAVGMSPTKRTRAAIAEVRPHLRDIGTRLAQGEAAFIETLMAHGGISKPEAERVYQTYRKLKVLKRDVASGVISVKHGGFLDRDTILRALEKT